VEWLIYVVYTDAVGIGRIRTACVCDRVCFDTASSIWLLVLVCHMLAGMKVQPRMLNSIPQVGVFVSINSTKIPFQGAAMDASICFH
jgi:hypothetical protein